ncbi:uncharacterized protein LOC143469665 isoform X2 [Clavelina lepadiformis]|uniref:uncharacterized protein LOC143469665 isoform X2 n=1 Tax=Clavelina lepadiformis TaxID=159417 RepID=UPI004041F1A5
MKIEELYEPIEVESRPVIIHMPTHVTKAPKRSKKIIKTKLPRASNIKLSPVQKQRQRRPSMMRLDQVNRHEEHSYLMDEETNQAILENTISKDELCRYLSPLKFLEIDTWRREVPFGLGHENEPDRRKWRTPIEILTARKGSKVGDPQSIETSNPDPKLVRSKTSLERRQNLSVKRRISTKLAETADKDNSRHPESPPNMDLSSRLKPGSATAQRHCQQPSDHTRPVTSPEKTEMISHINYENIVTSSRPSGAKIYGRSGDLSPNLTNRSGYSSNERVPSSGALYNRSPHSSSASLRRSRNSNSSTLDKIRNRPFYEIKDLDYLRSPHQRSNDDGEEEGIAQHPSLPSFQPGTWKRSFTSSKIRKIPTGFRPRIRSEKENSFETKLSLYKPHPPNPDQKKLVTSFSDPNIAYVPESSPKNVSNQKKKQMHDKVKNYYAQSLALPVQISPLEGDDEAVNAVASYNTVCGSITDRSSVTPRQATTLQVSPVSVSPRIIYPPTTRSLNKSSSNHSPWVSQALPDLSLNDKARAESDGYYVRKPNKSVTFRLREEQGDITGYRRGPVGECGQKPDVSMVVVNIDQVHSTPRNAISSNGAIGLARNSSEFATRTHSIPVRP